MAEKEEKPPQLETKIPVFSVLRNGCALKNIFLSAPGGELREEYEEMPVLMGRHPDCHIILDHPSISRFHLEIFAKPSIQKITILDRSSVHGTWVSGTKIAPNIPVEIKEGDILRLGASTREYRLQWLSLNEAYEMENPLPPLIEEKEENHQEEICQEVLIDHDEITTHGVPEEQLPFELEKLQQSPGKQDLTDTGLLSGPVLPASECTGTLYGDAASNLLSDLVDAHPISEQTLPYSESGESIARGTPARNLSDIVVTSMIAEPVPPAYESTGSILKATSSNLNQDLSNTSPISQLAPPASESVKSVRKGTPLSLLSRRPKSKSVSCLSIQTGITKEKAQLEEMSSDLFEKSVAKGVELDNEEVFESDKENMTPGNSCSTRNKAGQKTLCTMGETTKHIKFAMNSSSKMATKKVLVRKGVKKSVERLCASGKSNQNGGSVSLNSREILSEAKVIESCASTNDKVVPKLFASRSVKKSRTVCILGEKKQSDGSCSKVFHENEDSSTSVKQNGILQVSVRKSTKKSEETVQAGKSAAKILFDCVEDKNFGSVKENAILISPSTVSKCRPHSNSPGRALFQWDFEGAEEESCENFASDKENCTPDSKLAQKLRKPLFDDPAAVDIEISERKETERVPFQVLFDNHFRVPHNSPLKPLSTIPDNSSACWPQQQVQREKTREPRKDWIMVVDMGSLLEEESIKALRLLQGLRGTRLTIPRIVIRELDCMKRREGFFKRPNKQASLVLEWIEECMEREPLWIHVQSSAEAVPVAPTPPITPTSLFGDVGVDLESSFRSDRNAIYSPCSSFMEILTPTSEDHVLECALQFKKMKGYAEVVILSSSTTLKIKAMAEGLLCEEAKDFRNSLTNPYSKRFMWSSSNPMGTTRSCAGEAATIADNYNSKDKNPVFARRTFKATEAIRGLKLILLHNSHYAQTSLVN